MAIRCYLVYELKVVLDGITWLYFGITAGIQGFSDRACIEARKSWHLRNPVKCLKDIIGSATSVNIRKLKPVRTKSDALVDEARVTAAAYLEADSNMRVRGASWCGKRLPRACAQQMQQVLDARSRSAVRELGSDIGGLGRHLEGMSYHLAGIPFQVDPPDRSGTRVCGWYAFRRGQAPGSEKWPQGADNWDSMPEWKRARNGG